MTRVEIISERDGVVELKNVGDNNPWHRYFTKEVVENAKCLEELWQLTNSDVATHNSSWVYPFKSSHIEMCRENKIFSKRNEPLWRYTKRATTRNYQEWGICRIVDGYMVWRDGSRSELRYVMRNEKER